MEKPGLAQGIEEDYISPRGPSMLTTFAYKGRVYTFSSLDAIPLDIVAALKAIDEGRVPSLPNKKEGR